VNIFVLDTDIETCARYHCDQHVAKMILESVQMLCTTLSKKGFETPYRPTHAGHPCVRWVEASWDNFQWLSHLAAELNREYRYRYDREQDHASIAVLSKIEGCRFESNGLTEFAQAMPDEYKVPGDAVAAYRQFYMGEKSVFATWSRRPAPHWWSRHAA
jgi:hypothetical protein